MTRENDENDLIAAAYGWKSIDHPRGRDHCHSRYEKGRAVVWRVAPDRSGEWRSSWLINGAYSKHQSHDTITAAFDRRF